MEVKRKEACFYLCLCSALSLFPNLSFCSVHRPGKCLSQKFHGTCYGGDSHCRCAFSDFVDYPCLGDDRESLSLLSLSLVSIAAYLVAEILKNPPIYHSLLKRMLKGMNKEKT